MARHMRLLSIALPLLFIINLPAQTTVVIPNANATAAETTATACPRRLSPPNSSPSSTPASSLPDRSTSLASPFAPRLARGRSR
jgi:hypothetical protein